MMIPHELVEAIVSEADVCSLKACSLVSSGFCAASQRLLFRTLTLKGGREGGPSIWHPNYTRANLLLTKSPHLAAYTTHLEIYLPTSATPADEIESLRRVLLKLVYVRHCLLHGVNIWARWSRYPPNLSSDLLDFLLTQELKSLRIQSLAEIPPQPFQSFLASAPKLHFSHVSMKWGPAEVSRITSPRLSSITTTPTELLLGKDSTDASDLLSRSQFSAHLSSLRRLAVTVIKTDSAINLFSSVSSTLRFVCLDCRDFTKPHFSLPLPALPHLHSFEIILDIGRRTQPWFLESLDQIIASNQNSSLQEIIISYSGVERYRANPFYVPLLRELESLLLDLPLGIPRLRWRLGYGPVHVRQHGSANFVELKELYKKEMPELEGMKKLVVEKFEMDWRENV
ncbi:hypothetical protein R3P38DRAFT_3214311 [Favolaschia claudopus]|uniref:F-box domain-containing protein n=1 Tax=Favolaschia claudopus TaxID=2862362 RepID=A0AAW0AAS6_9AGAR